MPNIRQYTNPVNGLQPEERGAEGYNQEARRVGTFYHQIGEDVGGGIGLLGKTYENQVTTEQMLNGLKLKGQATEALMKDWNDTMAADASAPVHNPHLFDDWKKSKLDPAMDQLGQGFSTQEGQTWWQEQQAGLQQHFMERGMADQSTLTAGNAVRDFAETSNQASSLTYNDPNSGNMARGMLDQAVTVGIRALGADASPEAIEALKNHGTLAKTSATIAQARGMIDMSQDPKGAASSFLAKGEAQTYLDESQRAAVENYGEAKARELEVRAKAATQQARQQFEEEGKAAYANFFATISNPVTGQINAGPKAIAAAHDFARTYGGVLPGEAKSMNDVLSEKLRRNANHEDTQDDPRTFSGLMSLAGKPPSQGGLSDAQVSAAYGQGKLGDHSYHILSSLVMSEKTDPGESKGWELVNKITSDLKPSITKSDPLGVVRDTFGDTQYAAFQGSIHNMAQQHATSNKMPMAEVLQKMADPKDAWYIGKYTHYFLKGALTPTPDDATSKALSDAANEPENGVNVNGIPSAVVHLDQAIGAGVRAAKANPGGSTAIPDFDAWVASRRK